MSENKNVQPANNSSLKQTYTVQEVSEMLDIPVRLPIIFAIQQPILR